MKFKSILKKIKRRIFWKRLMYVIVDPADTSVTLSKELFDHIMEHNINVDKATAYVFRVKDTNDSRYAFSINPSLENTQMCDIQYNDKHKCIGFETLCPTVARILYDYNLPASLKVKLTVTYRSAKGIHYYQLEKPKDDTAN